MNKKSFNDFFELYAKNVDNANQHAFWQLSDALITQIIKDNIPTGLDKNATILDAGGGTGRWACKLAKIYKSKFIVYDLSRDMLEKANQNIKKSGLEKRISIFNGDLRSMNKIASNSISNVISIYSPISFIYDKDKAFAELYRILKKDGKIIIMGHGFFNAIASKINNYCARADELSKLDKEKMVKWGEHVPNLNVFSKEIMEKDLAKAGFFIVKTYGVPVFVQSGSEDFDPENKKKSRISATLGDRDFFNQVFEMEMKYNSEPTLVNRGMNIFSIGMKK